MSYDTMEVQTPDSRFAMDDKLFSQFYMRAVKHDAKSEAEGRPIFEDVPFVKIYIPGDKTSVTDVPVTEVEMRRWPKRWDEFQKNMQTSPEGTPLEEWPQLKTSQVHEFKALHVHTVEQLAGMSDGAAQRFMGGHELKRKAETFLKLAKDTAEAQRLAVKNAELQARLKSQDDQIRNLSAKVEILIQQKADDAAPSAQTRKVKGDERTAGNPGSM